MCDPIADLVQRFEVGSNYRTVCLCITKNILERVPPQLLILTSKQVLPKAERQTRKDSSGGDILPALTKSGGYFIDVLGPL